MIAASELFTYALDIVAVGTRPSEVERRRAITAAYYGLFHTLGEAAVSAIAESDMRAKQGLARTYNHSSFKLICEDVQRTRASRSSAGKALLDEAPSSKLVFIASQFSKLLQAREMSDYALDAEITSIFAIERVQLAAEAAETLTEIRDLPDTKRFLLALIFADRWPKRG